MRPEARHLPSTPQRNRSFSDRFRPCRRAGFARAALWTALLLPGVATAADGAYDPHDPFRLIARLNQADVPRSNAVALLVDAGRGPFRETILAALARGLARDNILVRFGCLEVLGRLGDEAAATLVLSRLPMLEDPLARQRAIRTLPAFWFPHDERRRFEWLRYAETPGAPPHPNFLRVFHRALPLHDDGAPDNGLDRLRTRILTALAAEIDPVAAALDARKTGSDHKAAETAVQAFTGDRLGANRDAWSEKWQAQNTFAHVVDPDTMTELRIAALATLGEVRAEATPEVRRGLRPALADPDDAVREAAWQTLEQMTRAALLDLLVPARPDAETRPPETEALPESVAPAANLFDAGPARPTLDRPMGAGDMPPDILPPFHDDPFSRPVGSARPLASSEADPTRAWPRRYADVLPENRYWPEGDIAERRRRHARALLALARDLAPAALTDPNPGVVAAAAGTLTRANAPGVDAADARAALTALERALGRHDLDLSARLAILAACGEWSAPGTARLLSAALRSLPTARARDGRPEGAALTAATLDAMILLLQDRPDGETAALLRAALHDATRDHTPVAGAPARQTLAQMTAARLTDFSLDPHDPASPEPP